MSGLEPSRADLEAWFAQAGACVLDHIAELPQGSAMGLLGTEGLDRAEAVSVPVPEHPTEDFGALLRRVMSAAEAGLNPAGPGYLAYIPGGGLLVSGLADWVANGLNRYTGLTAAAPALCRLEADVLAWLANEFGYGPQARGLLTSGGSLANFSAIVTARHAKLGDTGDYRRARVYTSAQAHHSVRKSVALAGIPSSQVVVVATDDELRLDPDALATAMRRDADAGQTPFLVVSAAGTTNTGAVDPLPAISAHCERHDAWHHVDGAYGGAFVLCPEGKATLGGIETADSITFDPHKGLFLPYGTGCLLVRDGERLRAAHQVDAEYLRDFDRLERTRESPSPTEYGPELSRDYRGLRVWLPLQLHGAAAFRTALSEKLALAQSLDAQLRDLPSVEVVTVTQLSVVAFRLPRRDGETRDDWNGRNARFCEAINARKRVYLSTTELPSADGPVLTLRVCVLSFRTHAEHMAAAYEDIAMAAESE